LLTEALLTEASDTIETSDTIEAHLTSALSTSALLSQIRIVLALIPRRHLALHKLVNAQLFEFFFKLIHFYYLRLENE
jgi:hypothetical protein